MKYTVTIDETTTYRITVEAASEEDVQRFLDNRPNAIRALAKPENCVNQSPEWGDFEVSAETHPHATADVVLPT